MGMLSFLDRDRSIAQPGYSRWLVPPAALAIHLAIGQAYAFSVFVNPLLAYKAADGSAWSHKEVGYVFSLAIAILGISAATFGKWLETAGPRKAMFAAASCFGMGFLVAALGAKLHSLPLIYLGYGGIGGVGLGLGYISPVSTLIKWFPDRPGLSTGLAIMGFGGGAMIGAPLATNLMNYFRTHTAIQPIAGAFFCMGILYFLFMMFGVFMIRVPAANLCPRAGPNRRKFGADHDAQRSGELRHGHTAVLAALGGAGAERDGGHRHSRVGLTDAQNLFPGKVAAAAAAGFVGFFRFSIWAGVSFGRRCLISSGARRRTWCSLRWERSSTFFFLR